MSKQPITTWLKSEPLPFQFNGEKIDVENGILHDVVMAQVGPVKGHGYHLEQGFIDSLVAYDQEHHSENGLKARFGHPAMSETTMGTQMGHFTNFRIKEGQAVADLKLLNAADHSPKAPNMKEWMLGMAQEAPDFVMSSIVFKPSGYYQYDPENGNRVDIEMNSWGDPYPEYENERIYVDFNEQQGARHLYTDLVESGAATDSLFSQQFNADKFAVRTIEWLQGNDDILSFIRENPGKLMEMAEKLQIDLPKTKLSIPEKFQQLKEWFHKDEEGVQIEEYEQEIILLKEDHRKELHTARTALQSEVETVQANLSEMEKENEQLKARIKELEEKHLAAATQFETKPAASGDSSDTIICETTKRALGKRK